MVSLKLVPVHIRLLQSKLKNFVNKYTNRINKMVFVSFCESTFEQKDDKFGHILLFNKCDL